MDIDKNRIDRTKSCKYCDIGFVDIKYNPFCSIKCKKEYSYNLLLDEIINSTKSVKNYKLMVKKLNVLMRFKKSKNGSYTGSLWNKYKLTKEEYNEVTKECKICNNKEIVDLHHIIPLSQGGDNIISNYIGLCPNHHRLSHLKKNELVCKDDIWEISKK